MSSEQYLYRRESGTYYVRLCVPARLKAAVGRGDIHRTTGCRDFRFAKIVAAELAIYWHRAIQSLDRMDITKIKAGSIKLLGDGFVALVEASNALGASPLVLAEQLIAKHAPISVEAVKWTGWPVADIYQALDHYYDEGGQLEVVLDAEKLGGLQSQTKFTGRLQLRFHEEVLAVVGAEASIGVCQFMTGASPDRGFVCDLLGQLISTAMLEIRKIDVEAIRLNLSAQVTPEMEIAARVST